MSYEIEVVSQPNARTGGYTARASAKGEQCFKDDMSETVARNTAKANLIALLERKEMLSKPSAMFNQEFIPSEHDDTDIKFDFGVAIRKLKEGERLMRQDWNGKNMWLIYIEADQYELKAWKYFNATEQLPFIAMKTADNKIVPWLVSQTDALATDWQLIK